MSDICVLCRKSLNSEPTNLEHFIHQVLIRNFDRLCLPGNFNWAMRKNTLPELGDEELIIAPISRHKLWATVKVHAKCNADMSYIGQDFKYIIDNIDSNIPGHKFFGIFTYYANLWNVAPDTLVVRILTENGAKKKYSNKNYDIVYEPYMLSCGRIEVECPSYRHYATGSEEDKVLHTIILGDKEAIIRL